jgi:CubicO group peptidase (beta-lactamase class C family)
MLVILATLLFSACPTPDIDPPEETPQQKYVIDSLSGSNNGSYEFDEDKLAQIVDDVEKGQYGNVHSLIIIHNDGLVMEEYFKGWTRHMLHNGFSVAKSIISALIGIGIEQGSISSVNEKLLSFFSEYSTIDILDGRKESITLKHVLTMSAGFVWDDPSTLSTDPESYTAKMRESSNWIKYVLDMPMSDNPGTEFLYNSGGSHLLSGILTNKTGQTAEQFAEEHLFNVLGITKWEWKSDPNGLTVAPWGLELHPVNMAMFGYLYLKKGLLNGEQSVPESWVEESTAKYFVVEEFSVGIMDGMFDYGYHWWRFNDSFFESFLWSGDPPKTNDIFYASGYGAQFIYVIPHLDIVMVFTGWEPNKPWLHGFLFNDLLNAVKEK